jgi:hypothetical protein
MNRELPRKVRKVLEIEIEKMMGPVEETLKNQLESIIRNCHEGLSQSYLRGVPPGDLLSTEKQAEVEGSTEQVPAGGPSRIVPDSRSVTCQLEIPPGSALPHSPEHYGLHPWRSSDYDMSFPHLYDPLTNEPSWPTFDFESLCHSNIPAPALRGKGKKRADPSDGIGDWNVADGSTYSE